MAQILADVLKGLWSIVAPSKSRDVPVSIPGSILDHVRKIAHRFEFASRSASSSRRPSAGADSRQCAPVRNLYLQYLDRLMNFFKLT